MSRITSSWIEVSERVCLYISSVWVRNALNDLKSSRMDRSFGMRLSRNNSQKLRKGKTRKTQSRVRIPSWLKFGGEKTKQKKHPNMDWTYWVLIRKGATQVRASFSCFSGKDVALARKLQTSWSVCEYCLVFCLQLGPNLLDLVDCSAQRDTVYCLESFLTLKIEFTAYFGQYEL